MCRIVLVINSFILFAITSSVCGDFWDNYIEIPPPPPESIEALPKCGEGVQKDKFKCVPYFNCDPLTNSIVDYPEVDGSNFISPRSNDARCKGHLEVCCQTNQTISSFEHVPTVELDFEAKCGKKSEEKLDPVWMVALLSLKNELLCGGSLLSPVVVLTAAHCVINFQPQEIKIRAGQWDLGNNTVSHQERNVSEFIIHEHFLSNKNVNTICVPTAETVATDNCFVTGWGKTSANATSYSRLVKNNYVSLITNKECQERYRQVIGEEFILDHSFICAYNVTGNVCIGDGGGPLVCAASSQRYFQVGIVSWGIKCDNWVPGVYTNVVRYRDWIEEKLAMLGYKSSSFTAK